MSYLSHPSPSQKLSGALPYHSRFLHHSHGKVPKQHQAILADAPEAIAALVAPPSIESERNDPRAVPEASCNYSPIFKRPYRDQVILAASNDVFAVWRPAQTRYAPVIARI